MLLNFGVQVRDPAGAATAIAAFTWVLTLAVLRFRFLKSLRRVIPGVEPGLGSVFLYLEFVYWRHRRRVGSPELDRQAAINLLASLLTVGFMVYFLRQVWLLGSLDVLGPAPSRADSSGHPACGP